MTRVRWLQAMAVIGATALLLASSCSWQLGTPVPDGVPPPPGDAVPQIDTYAKGRPADQLHEWAAQRAPGLGIPVTALEAYAYAARVAEVSVSRSSSVMRLLNRWKSRSPITSAAISRAAFTSRSPIVPASGSTTSARSRLGLLVFAPTSST